MVFVVGGKGDVTIDFLHTESIAKEHGPELLYTIQFCLSVCRLAVPVRIDNQPVRLHHALLNPAFANGDNSTVAIGNLLDNKPLEVPVDEQRIHGREEELSVFL